MQIGRVRLEYSCTRKWKVEGSKDSAAEGFLIYSVYGKRWKAAPASNVGRPRRSRGGPREALIHRRRPQIDRRQEENVQRSPDPKKSELDI